MGLAGYAYGVAGINLMEQNGNTDLALVIGLITPVLLAAVLGSIMFYARVQGVLCRNSYLACHFTVRGLPQPNSG